MLMNTGDEAGRVARPACSPPSRGGSARRDRTTRSKAACSSRGAAVQWLRDGLGLIAARRRESRRSRARCRTPAASYVVPAFAGLGAPHWRPDARGSIIGLTRGTTRAHIARATLEGIAFQSADLLDAMARDSGRRSRELRVDGGAAAERSADAVPGRPARRRRSCARRVVETTALGAAYLAGLGVGFWRSPRELERRGKSSECSGREE